MNRISYWLVGNQTNISQRNMIWNMVGSAVYSLTSMMLGVAVTRILNAELGGIFIFAFTAFGQQMFIVSYFGIRPIHITDTANRFTFGEYHLFRIYTSILALAGGILFALLYAETSLKRWVMIAMVCYKVIDGFADVYESEFQRNGKLYLTGKSNTFRTLLSVFCFLLVLWFTKDLMIASMVAVLAQLAGFLLMNLGVLKVLTGIDYSVASLHLKQLWKESCWLFLSAFLDLYIFSSSKYAIDAYMEPSASTYFGMIFIPASVINLAAGFIIRPFLTMLSLRWEERDFKQFVKNIYLITGAIILLTAAAFAGAYGLGIPVLSLLLGPEAGQGLQPYKGALLINIVGGGFYAVLNLLYYVLVIMKDQKAIFLVYGIGSAAAVMLAPLFVKSSGITGGAIAYLLLMVLLTFLFAVMVIRRYRRKE